MSRTTKRIGTRDRSGSWKKYGGGTKGAVKASGTRARSGGIR